MSRFVLKPQHRAGIEAASAVLDAAGVSWELRPGGKHLAIIITAPFKGRITLTGSGRSDAQSQANYSRQGALRLLREHGIGT